MLGPAMDVSALLSESPVFRGVAAADIARIAPLAAVRRYCDRDGIVEEDEAARIRETNLKLRNTIANLMY
jgi:hypothetical protein